MRFLLACRALSRPKKCCPCHKTLKRPPADLGSVDFRCLMVTGSGTLVPEQHTLKVRPNSSVCFGINLCLTWVEVGIVSKGTESGSGQMHASSRQMQKPVIICHHTSLKSHLCSPRSRALLQRNRCSFDLMSMCLFLSHCLFNH